jgi:GntR family transcriptional regulator, transcriptional repressor for pyruvate dehydrogenase complex
VPDVTAGLLDQLRLSKVNQDSAADLVRCQLIEMIETERIAVGERLPAENELAAAFGVSRPVVREALVSLRILGLTSSRSGRGTFVASNRVRMPLSFGGIAPEQLHEVRRYLEVPCARLAARRRTDKDLTELGRLVGEFESEADPAKRVKVDAQFHVAVARATGNPLFARLVDDLRRAMEEQSLAVSIVPGRREAAGSEHRKLYEAIRAGDEEGAERVIASHLQHLGYSMAELVDGQRPRRPAIDAVNPGA